MLNSVSVETTRYGSRHTASCQASCASNSTWHCIYTKPKQERAAHDAMVRAGFEAFLPRFQMVWRDRQKVIRPLFPRYTLARFDAVEDPWTTVVRDHLGREVGSVMVSTTTHRPLVIADEVVGALLGQSGADQIIYPPQPREMRRGDLGRVVDGPLAEFSGICSRTSRDRVWLLLDILGRKSEVGFQRVGVELAA